MCCFTLESDSLLSEWLSELRDAKRKSKRANFMQFSSRVSSFVHQLTALWVLMDTRMVIYEIIPP